MATAFEIVPLPHAEATCFHVGIIKHSPDAIAPWWERLYFRLIFRPFLRFSFRVFHVPTPDTLKADGSVSWFEHVGVFSTYLEADRACVTEFYVVTPLALGIPLPEQSCQRGGQTRPRATKPFRQIVPVFPLVPAQSRQLSELREKLQNISKVASTT